MPRRVFFLKRAVVFVVAGLAATVVLGISATAGAAPAAPVAFELEYFANHVPNADSAKFPVGFRHEGPFTASAPFCPTGTAVDLRHFGVIGADRLFTCDDGSGTATLNIAGDEHNIPGAWKFIEGTGPYATLRGQGASPGSLAPGWDHHANYRGVVDFDVVAPTISISTATVKKPARPKGPHTLKVVFSAPDNVAGNEVAYYLTARSAGLYLGSRSGQTSGTPASVTLRIRPPKAARTLRVQITASDQVQNAAKPVFRTVKIPR